MNKCVNKWTTNLSSLNDREFDALLTHAEICRFHADILDKYEADAMPFIRMACADFLKESVKTIPVQNKLRIYSTIMRERPCPVCLNDIDRKTGVLKKS